VAGIAAYTKFVRPETKIIAVEPEESACLAAALSAKKRVILDRVGIFADGVAVKQIGKQPFDLLKSLVDETIQVSTDEICAAVKDIFDDTRSIAEPAGALGVAGIKKYCARRKAKGKTYACLLSGANINFDRLRHISERAEIGEQKEALFAVTIPEKPGSFKTFCRLLGKRRVTEFNYRYASEKEAHIFVGIELEDPGVRQSIKSELLEKGYAVVDLTDDELAKLHIRHMVGGRGQGVTDEQLYRFQFPERPGALIDFLNEVGNRWNISLFHYRNHGAAYGRVLVGLQVPKGQKRAFKTFRDLKHNQYPSISRPMVSVMK
jgi:threonine dehydratase